MEKENLELPSRFGPQNRLSDYDAGKMYGYLVMDKIQGLTFDTFFNILRVRVPKRRVNKL